MADLIAVVKVVGPFLKKIYKPLKFYHDLKTAQPMTFTIGTQTEVGSMLFTTGRVISINLCQVVIDGYQVDAPQTTHGKFTIKLHSICGISHYARRDE
ncbi:hypothetical protein [Paludibacterium yongneupense]|uniref:hypothetical protein n=1 Tax=Paludibacterium yongneupense TaxID=400061 RepID=UPI00048B9A2A|nr:hypothetical protein [Paludibacterium yongneupense]